MVRTRAKKAKGDEAFAKRKQKVGRKKLAPVTATRAEVHARTLRLTTPAALSRVSPTPPPQLLTASPRTTRKEDAKNNTTSGAAFVSHSFTELLAGTRHYKASHRASAFAGLARLLEAAVCDADIASSTNNNTNTDVFLDIPSTTSTKEMNRNSTGGVVEGVQVSPLERLRGFTAALEAMTDTTEEVRQGALRVVRALLHLAQPAMLQGTIEVKDNEEGEDEEYGAVGDNNRDNNTKGEEEEGRGDVNASSGGTQMDRAKAVMQTVQICLTHAMKSVRLAGIALLALLLRHCPHDIVRRAARHIARLSHSISPLTLPSMEGTEEDSTSATSPQATINNEDDDAEVWMMAMVRRVSQLVLRDKTHVETLPALLDAFLRCDTINSSAAGCVWHRPALVSELLQELLPQWANAWKEWMELQLGLLRQEDRLNMAVSLARSVATILTFLKHQQQQQQVQQQEYDESKASRLTSSATLPKVVQQQIRDLFIRRVPVTMAEILREPTNSSNNNNSARVALALALARVAVPLATSEDGWRMLQQYFTLVFPVEGNDVKGNEKPQRTNTAALLSSVRVMTEALRLYPCSVHRPSRLYADMSEKLLRFCPRLVQAVVPHVDRLAQRPTISTTNNTNKGNINKKFTSVLRESDMMVYELLSEVGVVLRRAATYPLPVLRSTEGDALSNALRRCIELVPRLLFALRLQRHEATTTSVDAEDREVCEVSGLLLRQGPALVDRIVRRYLRVLWFVVSSGHPLCTQAMRDALRPALLALFGVRMGDLVMQGVLARCTSTTVRLARDVLFYLDVHTSAQMTVQGTGEDMPVVVEEEGCSAEDMQCVLTFLA